MSRTAKRARAARARPVNHAIHRVERFADSRALLSTASRGLRQWDRSLGAAPDSALRAFAVFIGLLGAVSAAPGTAVQPPFDDSMVWTRTRANPVLIPTLSLAALVMPDTQHVGG